MALGALGLFLLEAAAGTALLLLFFPVRLLGKGFFSLHGALSVSFLVLALSVSPPGIPARAAAAGAVLLAAYTLAAHGNRAVPARLLLAGGAALAGWSLARVAIAAPRGGGGAWTVSGSALGGLLFGAAVLTMNLGHWYLVSRSLPHRLLARGAMLFATLSVARTLFLAAAAVAASSSEGFAALLSPEREGLFFLFRVVWGIVGPLALSYFVWRTARMKSNQAATGLLYVALVFVLIGELLSSYLTVATGFPA